MIQAIYARRITILYTIWDMINQENALHVNAKTMQHADKLSKANEVIKNHTGFSMGAGLVPFPGADLLAVSAVQLNMLRQLAKLYNVRFMDSLGKTIVSTLVGSGIARLGASLVKAIPGVGTVIGELSMPALAGASTYALGRVVANHFDRGGNLNDLDLNWARKVYEQEMEAGKEVAEELRQEQTTTASTGDAALDKLRKLAELRDEGVITEEEFRNLKERLLAQI